jgi:hypothetical protein
MSTRKISCVDITVYQHGKCFIFVKSADERSGHVVSGWNSLWHKDFVLQFVITWKVQFQNIKFQ